MTNSTDITSTSDLPPHEQKLPLRLLSGDRRDNFSIKPQIGPLPSMKSRWLPEVCSDFSKEALNKSMVMKGTSFSPYINSAN
jgi:hypothetical protein